MATSTARDLLAASLRKIGVLAAGEPMEPDQASDALDELSRMLETWGLQRRLVFRVLEIVKPLTAGQASYTIGPGGQINTTRPLQIRQDAGFTRRGTLDFPLEGITAFQYDAIGLKALPAPWARWVYYDPAFPLGTITLWPVPSEANELHLRADAQFTSPATLNDTLSFPPGYVDALVHGLGKRLASEYGKTLSAEFQEEARRCEAALKTSNAQPVIADFDPRLAGTKGRDAGYILHGGYR